MSQNNATDAVHADTDHPEPLQHSRRKPDSIRSLLRTYLVYSACSMPLLVDWSPAILYALLAVPGIRQITNLFIRHTFFAQFVAGETAEETLPVLEQFREENKGVLFAYSVEVDESEAAGGAHGSVIKPPKLPMHKLIVNEMIHSIDVAADFEDQRKLGVESSMTGRRTWVAIKLTALLPDARSLISYSSFLVRTRMARAPDSKIPFPGYPCPTDLDILSDQATHPTSVSQSPLSSEDLQSLRELRDDLRRICSKAKERGVRIIIDAEYTWYQPAIDAFALELMREFNKLPPPPPPPLSPSLITRISGVLKKPLPGEAPPEPQDVQPLVYNTFQAYLRRTPRYLQQSLWAAKEGNYSLGVKLVRGAYHPHELAAHRSSYSTSRADKFSRKESQEELKKDTLPSISPERRAPVWPNKNETDECYNKCAKVLIDAIADQLSQVTSVPRLGVLFGTHNWQSCDFILDSLVQAGLASSVRADSDHTAVKKIEVGNVVGERVTLAQLYGMSDALTNSLVNRIRSESPFVIKYVPYGALSDVMPYLSRRAIENKSVLGDGGAVMERKRAASELRKMVLG